MIYQALYDLCQPFHLPHPWHRLAADADVRAGPLDLAEAVAHLAQSFTPDDLVRKRVACTTSEGILAPAPALSAGGPLVFLRLKPQEAPVEILTASGCLSGRRLPVLAAFADYRTVAAIRARDDTLLVATTLEDVAVLRALGFAATLATGLAEINLRQLERLSRHFGWKDHPRVVNFRDLFPDRDQDAADNEPPVARRGKAGPGGETGDEAASTPPTAAGPRLSPSAAPSGPPPAPRDTPGRQSAGTAARVPGEPNPEYPPDLTLVGWSPSRLALERPTPLEAVVAHLRAIDRFHNVKELSVALWVPGTADVEKLRYMLQFDPGRVPAMEMFEDVAGHSLDALNDPAMHSANYDEARQKYRCALRAATQDGAARGPSRKRVRRAARRFERELERQLLTPLLSPNASPRKRILQATLMEVSRLLHLQLPLAEAVFTDALLKELLGEGEPKYRGQLDPLSRLVRDVIALSREVRS